MNNQILINADKYHELVLMEIKCHLLEDRIDKVLKYIKKQKHWWEEYHYDGCGVDDDIEVIIKLLKGEDEEL